jgi:hypothetical protein
MSDSESDFMVESDGYEDAPKKGPAKKAPAKPKAAPKVSHHYIIDPQWLTRITMADR